MAKIIDESELSSHLDLGIRAISELAGSVDQYCESLLLIDPAKPNKQRQVLNVRGPLRRAQSSIHRRILLPRLRPSSHSFGGVRGRHIKANAHQHLTSKFAFTCDISDFYPSIHYKRVEAFFTHDLRCSPLVASLLTRLCTFQHHLALGLITSPILADQFLKLADVRIGKMADNEGLIYSRYVDDIIVSGPFDFRRSGFPKTIKKVLLDYGFKTNPAKDTFGQVGDPDLLLTQLRVKRGRLDVSKHYLDKLCTSLSNLRALGLGGEFSGLYHTRSQIEGRIQFVTWVSPGRTKQLQKLFRAVPWDKVREQARLRGLVVARKELVRTRGPAHMPELIAAN